MLSQLLKGCLSVLLDYQLFLLPYVPVSLHVPLHVLSVNWLVEVTDLLELFLSLDETWDLIGLFVPFIVNFIEGCTFLLDFCRPSLTYVLPGFQLILPQFLRHLDSLFLLHLFGPSLFFEFGFTLFHLFVADQLLLAVLVLELLLLLSPFRAIRFQIPYQLFCVTSSLFRIFFVHIFYLVYL